MQALKTAPNSLEEYIAIEQRENIRYEFHEWKIFWMRASGKWEHLQNFDSIKSPAAFFQLVQDDPMGTFFGKKPSSEQIVP